MLGAIIGDIVGSRFEWNNNKTKDFDFLTYRCCPTDDSIMSLAIAKAILMSKSNDELSQNAINCMQDLGNKYPNAGYGGSFVLWLTESNPKPYNSWGNGAAMRVSACGFAATSLDEAKILSKLVTEVTHNHPEGIKGAEATAVAIYMAKNGSSLLEIQDYINKHYYKIDFKLDDIRPEYTFDVSCQGSVPQALEAFFESTGFEDAIRNAISIGGDSDTIAAITGGIAEAYYGIPAEIRKHALTFLDKTQLSILNDFESKYGMTSMKKTATGTKTVKYTPNSTPASSCEEATIGAVTNVDDFVLNYKDTISLPVKVTGTNDYIVEIVSSNESVATVDKKGNITAVGTGEAEITVTVTDEYGKVVKDTCTVTVNMAWWQWIIYIVFFGWIWY